MEQQIETQSWFEIEYNFRKDRWASSLDFPGRYTTADEALAALRTKLGPVTVEWLRKSYRVIQTTTSTRVVGGFNDSL